MNIIKRYIFISILLFTAEHSFPQQNPNSIYLELLGSGGFFSMNYDRLFTTHLGGRIGISYFAYDGEMMLPPVESYLFPVSLNYFIGGCSSKLEIGAGITIESGKIKGFGLDGPGTTIVPNFNFGFRYQPADGGIMFRIAFTPLISSRFLYLWGGLSIGYTF